MDKTTRQLIQALGVSPSDLEKQIGQQIRSKTMDMDSRVFATAVHL